MTREEQINEIMNIKFAKSATIEQMKEFGEKGENIKYLLNSQMGKIFYPATNTYIVRENKQKIISAIIKELNNASETQLLDVCRVLGI